MKKLPFNPLYIILLLAFAFILQTNWNFKHKTYTFFGFAQNKETEINYEESLLIDEVNVIEGAYVQKGDTLMTATRHQEIDKLEINDAEYDIEVIRRNQAAKRLDIQSAIRRLQAQRINKVSEIQSDIRTLQAEIDLNKAVLSQIKSVDVSAMNAENSPAASKMKALKKELELVAGPIDVEIEKLKAELNAPSSATIRIDKLRKEATIHKTEYDQVIVTAPTDGLIGNVHFKKGENANKFSTLISFYERNPNVVIGYVHENLIVYVEEGDSIQVTSSYHPENQFNAVVISLGTRIIEIPARLRKIPEIKSFGREVIIQLPLKNTFLQKEKVILNLLNVEDIDMSTIQQNRTRGKSDIDKLLDQ
jgi:multidrug resistance efflux pump